MYCNTGNHIQSANIDTRDNTWAEPYDLESSTLRITQPGKNIKNKRVRDHLTRTLRLRITHPQESDTVSNSAQSISAL